MPRGYFTAYTKQQEDKIIKEYLVTPIKVLATETNSSFGRVTRFLKKNGLEVPKELALKRIKSNQKKKGDISFNKGKKQIEYMTPEAIERTRKTRFKKGRNSTNILKVGTERITQDGYVEIKIANPNKWILKQRFIYENLYKIKLKTKELVIFLDGNKRNFNPNNLKKITQVENMYRNSKHNYPEEIIPTLLITNKIKKYIQNGK